MERFPRWSWFALLASIGLTPLATSSTSMTLRSLPLTYDQFVVPKLAMLGVLVAVALSLWALGATGTLRWTNAGWPAVALLGVAAVSTAFSLDPTVAFFGRDAGNGLLAYLCYGAVLFLVIQHVRGTAHVAWLTRTVVASGAIASVFSLYQAAVITPEYLESIGLGAVGYLYGRGGGLFGNPDYVGAFLVAPFILGLALLRAEKDRRFIVAAGVMTAFIAAAAVVTQVRGAWLGILAGVALLGLMLLRVNRPTARQLGIGAAVVAVAITAGLLLAGPGLVAKRVTSGLDGGLNEFSGDRIQGWQDALRVIADRPLTGTGPDSFTLGWYKNATALADPSTGASTYFEDPHSFPLAVASTMGVAALLALIVLVVFAARAGLRTLSLTEARPDQHALYAGWLAAYAGLIVASLLGVTTIPLTLSFFVVTAALITPSATARESAPLSLTAARASAAVLAFAVIIGASLPLLADYHLGQFKRTGAEGSIQTARSLAPWSKTVQLEYLEFRRAQIVPLLAAGGDPATLAVDTFDTDAFRLIERHPHELEYVLKRIDVLGQAAGQLAGEYPDKALTVINLAILDYPNITDLQISKARALNNAVRYDESIELLEPLPTSLMRDAALAESYLLAGRAQEAKRLVNEFARRYSGTPLGDAFLAQPSIAPIAK